MHASTSTLYNTTPVRITTHIRLQNWNLRARRIKPKRNSPHLFQLQEQYLSNMFSSMCNQTRHLKNGRPADFQRGLSYTIRNIFY